MPVASVVPQHVISPAQHKRDIMVGELLGASSSCFCPCGSFSQEPDRASRARPCRLLVIFQPGRGSEVHPQESNKHNPGGRLSFLCRSSVRPTTSCQRVPLCPPPPPPPPPPTCRPPTPLARSVFFWPHNYCAISVPLLRLACPAFSSSFIHPQECPPPPTHPPTPPRAWLYSGFLPVQGSCWAPASGFLQSSHRQFGL